MEALINFKFTLSKRGEGYNFHLYTVSISTIVKDSKNSVILYNKDEPITYDGMALLNTTEDEYETALLFDGASIAEIKRRVKAVLNDFEVVYISKLDDYIPFAYLFGEIPNVKLIEQ